MTNSNELQHWGIKNMKWGQRRFQNKDGSLTPAGRKRYGVGDGDNDNNRDGGNDNTRDGGTSTKKSVRDMSDEELDAAIKRARKEKEYDDLINPKGNNNTDKVDANDPIAAKKSRILESDSAKNLYDNRDLFTTQELQEAYKRLNTEKLIRDMQPKELSKGEKFINTVTKIGNTASTVYNAYNNVQKFAGLFKDDKGSNTVNAGGKKKNKDTAEKANDAAEVAKNVVDTVKNATSGTLNKYASMDTSSIKTKPVSGKSISDYASYGKESPTVKKFTSGSLSKYSSIDTATVKAGESFVKDVRDNFNYYFTDKDKK